MVKPHHIMMKPHHIIVKPHHVMTNDHIRKLWLSIHKGFLAVYLNDDEQFFYLQFRGKRCRSARNKDG